MTEGEFIAIQLAPNGAMQFDLSGQPKRMSDAMALLGQIVQRPGEFTRSPSDELGHITIRVTRTADGFAREVQANALTDDKLAGIGWWAMQEYHHIQIAAAQQRQAKTKHREQQQVAFAQALGAGRIGRANGSR